MKRTGSTIALLALSLGAAVLAGAAPRDDAASARARIELARGEVERAATRLDATSADTPAGTNAAAPRQRDLADARAALEAADRAYGAGSFHVARVHADRAARFARLAGAPQRGGR